jgi:hypothetical protein
MEVLAWTTVTALSQPDQAPGLYVPGEDFTFAEDSRLAVPHGSNGCLYA